MISTDCNRCAYALCSRSDLETSYSSEHHSIDIVDDGKRLLLRRAGNQQNTFKLQEAVAKSRDSDSPKMESRGMNEQRSTH